MGKSEKSREVPKWETLNRDILAIIFGKLHMIDIAKGASRVCISWFLASHDKTLWNTVDLAKRQKVDGKSLSLSLSNILTKIIKFVSNSVELTTNTSLRNITKLSHTAPKNLFFNFKSYIQEEDLMFSAERMPNIEKLALPCWVNIKGNSLQFAFSQWKNLKTLIIAHDQIFAKEFDFQAVGKNCNNLTNLKYLGYLERGIAEQIVRYLQSVKRLSLRCSIVTIQQVLLLITGLQNLAIINLSHCIVCGANRDTYNLVEAATQKLDKFISCSPKDCRVCKDRRAVFVPFRSRPFRSKDWQNDEIKEFAF